MIEWVETSPETRERWLSLTNEGSFRVVIDHGDKIECIGRNLTTREAEELIEAYNFENPKPQDNDFPVVRKEKE